MSRSQLGVAGIRSVADVIDHVIKASKFGGNFEVHFSARSYIAPDGTRTGFVAAVAHGQLAEPEVSIAIPACSDFFGSLLDGTGFPPSNIANLNGAVATPDGTVRLRPSKTWPRGAIIKNVRYRPAPLDCSFLDIEHAVVQLAVSFNGAERECYGEIAPELVPGFLMLDYGRLAAIKIESSKPLVNYIEDRLRELLHSDRLTPEMQEEYKLWLGPGSLRNAIERTLKKSGMRPARQSRKDRRIPA